MADSESINKAAEGNIIGTHTGTIAASSSYGGKATVDAGVLETGTRFENPGLAPAGAAYKLLPADVGQLAAWTEPLKNWWADVVTPPPLVTGTVSTIAMKSFLVATYIPEDEIVKDPPPAKSVLRVPSAAYANLQAALTAATPGDHIELENGTYSTNEIIAKSGSALGYIVIKSRNHLGAKITGNWKVTGDYIWLNRLNPCRPGQHPGTNKNDPYENSGKYNVVLAGKRNRVTNCLINSSWGIWIESAKAARTQYIEINRNDFCATATPMWSGGCQIYMGKFEDDYAGAPDILIARNHWHSDIDVTHWFHSTGVTTPRCITLPSGDTECDADGRYCVYTGNSHPGDNNSGNNRRVKFFENIVQTTYIDKGPYFKRTPWVDGNYFHLGGAGASLTLRHGGYSKSDGTVFTTPPLTDAVRGLITRNNFNRGRIIVNDTDHLWIGNRFNVEVDMICGCIRPPPKNPGYENAASRNIFLACQFNSKLNLGPVASSGHVLNDAQGGKVAGVLNYPNGVTPQPTGANLNYVNALAGDAGYKTMTGTGGRTPLDWVQLADLTPICGCDEPSPTGPIYTLPTQPTYEGPTYYVSASSSSGPSTNPSSRGGLQQTIQGVNDGAIIVCGPGAYAGFTTGPKAGQQGRIKIIGENPVFTGIDTSSIDGTISGYNPSGSFARLSGAVTLNNFGGIWVEGFRLGTTSAGATNARFLIGHRSGTTGWYVRNYHYNLYTQQSVHDGPGSVVCYQNYHTADGYEMYGVADYTSDYGVFATNLDNIWIAQSIFRGVMSKPISLKQNIINGYIYDNVFDFSSVVAGRSAAYLIVLGQVCDAEVKDNTIGYARAAYNKLRIGSTGVMFMSSNVGEAMIEDNVLIRTGGKPYVLMMDAIDEKYNDGSTLHDCCQRNSRHPELTTFRNNTIKGGATNLVWAMGKTWVKSTAPNGRTRLQVEQNTIVGGGAIAAVAWNASFPDGQGSYAVRGANSQHTGDEPIMPTFGTNAGLAPMS